MRGLTFKQTTFRVLKDIDGMGDDPWQGDGSYGADVWGTGEAGTYQVALTATGTGNDAQPFTASASASVSLAPGVDSDGDGITDEVETYLGLTPEDPTDGAVDADSDGLSLSQELAAGTDPWNPDAEVHLIGP